MKQPAGHTGDREHLAPEALRQRLDFDDALLLAECEVDTYRASGPGGQHRNKVSSAVRLRHKPSGLTVIAEEDRSQHANRAVALHRLRTAIALAARLPLPDGPPQWPTGVQLQSGKLRISESNPAFHHVLARLLDAVVRYEGRISAAARALQLTGSNLTRLLAEHPKAWAWVSELRERRGLPRLKH